LSDEIKGIETLMKKLENATIAAVKYNTRMNMKCVVKEHDIRSEMKPYNHSPVGNGQHRPNNSKCIVIN